MLTISLDQKAIVERMKQKNTMFSGNFAFFNNWKLFWSSGTCFHYKKHKFERIQQTTRRTVFTIL